VHTAALDPTSEAVYQAIEALLDELTDYFPDPCIHIGGDEVHPEWWSNNERIAEFMRQRGMTGIADLQNYFNLRVGEMVAKLGRQVVAWDEVVHKQLPADWIVQAWRGATSRDRVRARGNRVLMSAPYYLDLHYSAEVHYRFDPAASQSDLVELEDRLAADPRCAHVAGGMRWTRQWRKDAISISPPVADPALLGAEACLWGELVNAEVLDQRLWSRLPALAELFWSDTERLDSTGLTGRLRSFREQALVPCGIDLTAQLSRALADLGIDEEWQALAALLEPVKWYGRLLGEQALAARLAGAEMPQARPYGTRTALDKLADALPPASEQWELLLSMALNDPGSADRAELLDTLQQWRELCETGRPSELLQPLLPSIAGFLSAMLARLAGELSDPEQLAELMVPQGELMLAPPPVFLRWLSEA
jgi:hexosaminidase